MSKLRSFSLALVLLVAAERTHGAAAEQSPWDSAFDTATKQRFIPVELWTGMEWDGSKELDMAKAEKRFGDRAQKDIKGPMEWKHPVTGATLMVYERTNQERTGIKSQLFAMNEEKTGLGRVYDARRDLGTRTFSGGLKFPLGYWQPGESKRVVEKRYEGSKVETRIETITITQLDFTFRSMVHCLEFEWVYRERENGRNIDHQTYTYCPNQGMVKQVQH